MYIYDSKIFQFFKDISNLKKFRKIIKAEENRANSKFTKLNLKRNWFGNIVYTQIDCTEADLANVDYDRMQMLDIKLRPYVDYLSKELNWGDYLVPSIANFVDDDGKESLSYGVSFIFTGYTMTLTSLLMWTLFKIILLGGGIWAAIHFLL